MKEYTVHIEESVTNEFKVKANSKEEAIRIAEKKYYNCEFVVYPAPPTSRMMAVTESENEEAEWFDF